MDTIIIVLILLVLGLLFCIFLFFLLIIGYIIWLISDENRNTTFDMNIKSFDIYDDKLKEVLMENRNTVFYWLLFKGNKAKDFFWLIEHDNDIKESFIKIKNNEFIQKDLL